MVRPYVYLLAVITAFLALFFNSYYRPRKLVLSHQKFKPRMRRPGALSIEEYLAQLS